MPESRSHLERSLRLAEEARVDDESMAAFLLSHCELSLLESNVDAAGRFATKALQLAKNNHAITTMADSHAWLGRVASVRGDAAAADQEFAAAFEVLREPGASPELMSRTYARYADVLEARGDIAGAIQQLKRALVSRSSHMAFQAGSATG